MAGDALVVEPETNRLIATALPQEQERIVRLLARLDARPLAVVIQCQLTRIGPDGQRTVLSKPQVHAPDGTEAMISVSNSDESLELTLVPTIVLSDSE